MPHNIRLAPYSLSVPFVSHTYTQTAFIYTSFTPAHHSMLWPCSFIRDSGHVKGGASLGTEWNRDSQEDSRAGWSQDTPKVWTGSWVMVAEAQPAPSLNNETNERVTSDTDKSVLGSHDPSLYLLIYPFSSEPLSLKAEPWIMVQISGLIISLDDITLSLKSWTQSESCAVRPGVGVMRPESSSRFWLSDSGWLTFTLWTLTAMFGKGADWSLRTHPAFKISEFYPKSFYFAHPNSKMYVKIFYQNE